MIHAIECDCPARIVRTFTDDVHVADPVIAAMSMSPLFWSSRGANMRPIDTAIRQTRDSSRRRIAEKPKTKCDAANSEESVATGWASCETVLTRIIHKL
jgi:hypothetical protein